MLNPLLGWLRGGDLRSDGLSEEVVQFILQHPDQVDDLIHALTNDDDVVRGRAADAIEHVAREIPEKLTPYQVLIVAALREDPVPMVRWHLAMVLGHMAGHWEEAPQAASVLLECLQDPSAFTVSWTIVSLCIFARLYPDLQDPIMSKLSELLNHPGTAIRTRAQKAVQTLSNPKQAFPKGWIKSESILAAIERLGP
jgi:HEAT repeat protein